MNRKMNKLLQPSFRLYFACLILFALLSAAFSWQLALVELGLVGVGNLHHFPATGGPTFPCVIIH